MDDVYKEISEVKQYIKSLFNEVVQLEMEKSSQQEFLFDRIIYLLELYINNEVELYIKKLLPDIIKRVVDEVREEQGLNHGR
jgi:regulator of replication initiation timing